MSYDRRKVLKALRRLGVEVMREGGSHTIIQGPEGDKTSLPRHKELDRRLVRKIVGQLGLDWQDVERDL